MYVSALAINKQISQPLIAFIMLFPEHHDKAFIADYIILVQNHSWSETSVQTICGTTDQEDTLACVTFGVVAVSYRKLIDCDLCEPVRVRLSKQKWRYGLELVLFSSWGVLPFSVCVLLVVK